MDHLTAENQLPSNVLCYEHEIKEVPRYGIPGTIWDKEHCPYCKIASQAKRIAELERELSAANECAEVNARLRHEAIEFYDARERAAQPLKDSRRLRDEEYKGFIRASELLEQYGPTAVWELSAQHRIELETPPLIAARLPSTKTPIPLVDLGGAACAQHAAFDDAGCNAGSTPAQGSTTHEPAVNCVKCGCSERAHLDGRCPNDFGAADEKPAPDSVCSTCNGTGEIDETLGGECFSNPHAPCHDCDGPADEPPGSEQ